MLILPVPMAMPDPEVTLAYVQDQKKAGDAGAGDAGTAGAGAGDAGTGSITVTGRKPSADDPLEKTNVKVFKATAAVDDAVVAPVASVYKDGVPKPLRNGLRNFLNNLREPVVALNYLLQHRVGKAAETVARFGVNSTLGVAGVMDVAKTKPFKLPPRVNGFADTFAYYGVASGPYLYLPLIGPTTPRDLTGVVLDKLVLPFGVGGPFKQIKYTLPLALVDQVDQRVRFDEQIKAVRSSSDPYLARRNLYFQQRAAEICAVHRPGWEGCQQKGSGADDKLTTQSGVNP